eukprot:TRINITY_DN15494_c0_g1_i1.p1 TRINITY_DN15494_c0_g1~~TRINITY_DN15494_c0_g1_i1.p1  ORF type:complete len:113 (+),score=59.50 TRINITY_DN15494_c0_g1_i1:30-341(+)
MCIRDRNNNFGIKPDKLHFFQQGMLPSLDFNGKILLEKKAKISLTPNGNGGVFSYLLESDSMIFPEMTAAGVEYLQIIGIDNCLLYTSPSPRDQRGSRMPSSA